MTQGPSRCLRRAYDFEAEAAEPGPSCVVGSRCPFWPLQILYRRDQQWLRRAFSQALVTDLTQDPHLTVWGGYSYAETLRTAGGDPGGSISLAQARKLGCGREARWLRAW